jgi:hypothetical protein
MNCRSNSRERKLRLQDLGEEREHDCHGCRRYDPMDGGGRIASGTAIESNAGAIAEERKLRLQDVGEGREQERKL